MAGHKWVGVAKSSPGARHCEVYPSLSIRWGLTKQLWLSRHSLYRPEAGLELTERSTCLCVLIDAGIKGMRYQARCMPLITALEIQRVEDLYLVSLVST